MPDDAMERARQPDSDGRIYYHKRVGWHWEVWFAHRDGSPDPANGATEWRAVWGIRFWRRINAIRVANDMWVAFNDGRWVGPEKSNG